MCKSPGRNKSLNEHAFKHPSDTYYGLCNVKL